MLFNTKAYFLTGFFHIISYFVIAQDQRVADSLRDIYIADTLDSEEKLKLLRNLSFNEINDLNLALQYAEELISLSKQNDSYFHLTQGYFQKGNAHQYMGNLKEALASYFKSAEIAKRENLIPMEGSSYGTIADIYSISDNHKNAMLYYNMAIATLRQSSDSIRLASVILNAGDALLINKEYDAALVYFKESGEIFEKVNYESGKAYNMGNIGMVYAEQAKDDLAEANINEAIEILEIQKDFYPISVYLTYMSDIYLRKKDFPTALNYAHKSLELATKYNLKDQINDANLKLSELYDVEGNQALSYKHYKAHIVYRDSVKNIEAIAQMADQRTNYEVSQKQIELDLSEQREKNQRNLAIGAAIGLFLLGILAIGLFRRNTFIRKTKQIIEEERDRSDKLLLNILPEETAAELKANGKVKAKKYDAVTVLFTDFKGFTHYSEKLSPEALVETVDYYFSKFDAIIEKHGLEKIKTIGDAYMCVGGLHDNKEDHAQRMVHAALEIANFVVETKKDGTNTELTFDVRIGINSGPVVAGVVGTKKFAYDIWGDTVNVASRMESMSEPGKINVSKSTFELIRFDFDCDYRGEIEAKNKGKIKMYFVKGTRREFLV